MIHMVRLGAIHANGLRTRFADQMLSKYLHSQEVRHLRQGDNSLT
jgi:hypothetical protein